jgi:hypothetical protein
MVLTFVAMICTIGANRVIAKSVYAITDHHAGTLKAYKIQGDLLGPPYGQAVFDEAVGVTIDSNLELLFITYEGAGKIVWANAKTLEQEGFIDLGEYVSSLAGIIADEQKQRIYVVERDRDKLYILAWNASQKELVLMDPNDPNQPYSEGDPYVTLMGLQTDGGWGIALDENTRRLYVANNTTNVHVYDADDPNWTHIDPPRDVGREAMAVAVDPNNGQHNAYLYVGGFKTPEGGFHTYLVKHDLEADANQNTEQNIEAVATGLAVDVDTGLVYCTTAEYSPEDYQVRVYDCSTDPFICTYSTPTGGTESGPAGICVPTRDVSYKPPVFYFEKVDDAGPDNRPSPGDYINYTIYYDANGHSATDVNIIDYLPGHIDLNDVNASDGGVYDSNTKTVTWQIGNLQPDDSNFVTLTVRVNPDAALPLETLLNFCEMESDSSYNTAYCLTPDIIYVDIDANDGNDTGLSWRNAFTDLQSALQLARKVCSGKTQIWAAEGNYPPTTDPYDSGANFALVDGVAMYGGFAGTETYRSQRNWITNETVLTGDVDDKGYKNVFCVVTASGVGETTIIDGFVIRMGSVAGVKIDSASPTIEHNKITQNYDGIRCENQSSVDIASCDILSNDEYGIHCIDSNSNITGCLIQGNDNDGIYCGDCNLMVSDCNIDNNGGDGIDHDGSAIIANNIIHKNENCGILCAATKTDIIEVKNNWIYGNGTGTGGDKDGVYVYNLYGLDEPAMIRNNTVAKNTNYGIGLAYNYPEDVSISNCIIWGNGDDLYNCSATYSCISNDDDGEGNIYDDPCFVDEDANNFHLSYDSNCIDAGDNTAVPADTTDLDGDGNTTEPTPWDIDGESRFFDDPYTDDTGKGTAPIVDMGADEYYWSLADYNEDGIVNFIDYAYFADAWQSENADISLDDDNDVDIDDLALFCEDWLWQPAWTQTFSFGWSMGCGIGGGMQRGAGFEQQYYSAEPAQQQPQVEPIDVEEMVDWLEEIWATEDELREMITEDEWQEFIEKVKEEM